MPRFPRSLQSSPREIGSPAIFGSWSLSPSRKQVAFLIHENGTDALRIAPFGGNEPRLLYRTLPGRFLAKSGAFAWTRDEEAVIATMGTYANPSGELWWFPVRAGTPRRILSTGGLKDLRMHPDGVRFSFTADGFRQSIWAVRNALPIRAQPSQAK